jgi:Domain of unknown function (DUF4259)
MGAWGTEPWDNDGAADWFGDLWEGIPIAGRVLETLQAGTSDEVVAAIWLCSELCRAYVWPIGQLKETLSAAVAAADRILAGDDDDDYLALWDNPAMTSQIQSYRDSLASRIAG